MAVLFSTPERLVKTSPRPEGPYDRQAFVDARGCIPLPGFQPVQYGSYAAIKLPHRWELWGLDIDSPLDPKQRGYFLSVRGLRDLASDDVENSRRAPWEPARPAEDPQRLILCTPSPPVIFGSVHLHPQHAASLRSLRVSQRYVSLQSASSDSTGYGQTRLDLSGDTHHYTRYQPTDSRYAAVVSGLGGAFHHPTFTKTGDIAPTNVYPAVMAIVGSVHGTIQILTPILLARSPAYPAIDVNALFRSESPF